MSITRFSRDEFLQTRWNYGLGQHVILISPNQKGKTMMISELLAHTDFSRSRIPPVMLIAKPQDPVVAQLVADLEYREIEQWPPTKPFWKDPPPGYALWPKHIVDAPPEVNAVHLGKAFRAAMSECFWGGNSTLIADEVYHLCAIQNMQPELTQHWTQGAGMGAALWTATQKPGGTQQGSIPTFMYNSPTHTFLGRDNDERNRKRFAEIGGVNPKTVEETVLKLQRFEWLYIHRDGPTMCIVEARPE